MRCGIAEYAQRIKRGNRLLGLLRIVYALRLVNDNDGICRLYVAYRRIAVELVLLLVNDVFRLTECVNIDDHDLDIGADGKLPHVGQLRRIIDKVSAGRIVIERRKMLLRCLQGFIHALADGYAGHNNDKLGKTIKAV